MDDSGHRPKECGLLDPRMGSIDRNYKCATCSEDMAECPGHFGHLELCRPVFHCGFIIRVKKILECICYFCGRLKADKENVKFSRALHFSNKQKRFKAVWEACKTKTICDAGKELQDSQNMDDPTQGAQSSKVGCGHKQPMYRKEALKLYATFKADKHSEDSNSDEKLVITAQFVLQTFKKITDADLEIMGLSAQFARPEWMVLSNLPVPPPCVRPSIVVPGMGRGEDDLTHKLSDIIKANDQLKTAEAEGEPTHILDEYEFLLQFHVSTFKDNDVAGLPAATQKSGRPVKSLRARLKGKEGRIRGNLMGKRVDFSARTVITGDPMLSINEVGVPFSIARNLTYPEMVTSYNFEKMQNLVRNGPTQHPGAKYVIRDDGVRIDLRHRRATGDMALQVGFCVERHIDNGDVVIFNRQPSLHKMSMMGHHVRVLPFSTFRLNLSVTSPYNADFDGDEMNMHVPQSHEARSEVLELMMVSKQIVSPQGNKPVMGIVQDSLCGVRKFTKRDCFLSKEFVQNLVLWIPDWNGYIPPPCIQFPVPLWTGKQLLSLLIPTGINMTTFHAAHPDDEKSYISPGDTRVEIVNGEIIAGIICKRTVGAAAGGLIHTIYNELGEVPTTRFLNGTQTLVNYWFMQNSFSIAIGDMIADRETMKKVNQSIADAKIEVARCIEEAQRGTLQPLPGLTVRETFESRVNQALNKARDDAGKMAERSLPEYNNIKQMVVSGSKGSFVNISQMAACVGQQNVESARIPFGFQNRTLPHFTKYDQGPVSRGFVENSYLRGLTPQEFFFHAMGGREGLIDTAVKTAETGYIQRRLVKALEDVMVNYDGTVRNSLGQIVQFCYGEDGMDAAFIEKQRFDNLRLSNLEFENKYLLTVKPSGELNVDSALFDNDAFLDAGISYLAFNKALADEFAQLLSDRNLLRNFVFTSGENEWPMPVNIKRLIRNAQVMFHCHAHRPTNLHPSLVISTVERLLKGLTVIRGNDALSEEANTNATILFKVLVRSILASKRVLEEFHLTTEAFEWLVAEIQNRFNLAQANPGEMVGTLAAQSIGEPATQMTLNTFHLAGVSSANGTQGVPRLKEIINVATNLRTPGMTVHLSEDYCMSDAKAKSVQINLEHCTLASVTNRTQIFYDPDPSNSVITQDTEWLFQLSQLDDSIFRNVSKWVLRVELNSLALVDKNLTPQHIADEIQQKYNGEVICFATEENAEPAAIHCRISSVTHEQTEGADGSGFDEDNFLRRLETNMLTEITLRGISAIKRVFIMKRKNTRIDHVVGQFQTREEFILETDGTNLQEVMYMEQIDPTRVYSNNIVEITEVLGIEAGRNAILKELSNVIRFGGAYVNYRHLSLLCDIMTTRGNLMAITRHGINRTDSGALMRCSFEETVEILMDAAAVGDFDDCKGISENIMLGQVAPLGSGSFDVLLDETALFNMPRAAFSVNDHKASGMADNSMYSPMQSPYSPQMTPYDGRSPERVDMFGAGSPAGVLFSPIGDSGASSFSKVASPMPGPVWGSIDGTASPAYIPNASGASPVYSPSATAFSISSPKYSPASPSYSPTSPLSKGGFKPESPSYSPTSPRYSAASPGYSPTARSSGLANLTSFSPTSPSYSPTSPRMATNSAFSPFGNQGASQPFSPSGPSYSPTSPSYSPSSPLRTLNAPSFSPTSPSYSPSSPSYSPSAAAYSPIASGQSVTSPAYRPTGASYSPTSPSYSPAGPSFSPASPSYSPSSPSYARASYTPGSPSYSPLSPGLSAASPGGARASYNPTSPSYSPNSPAGPSASSSHPYSNVSNATPFTFNYPLGNNQDKKDSPDSENTESPKR
ncbi:DNA-directed RNA polymerase II core subunit rpo21 [Entomophthora muscae]|uniref:DNA-directed RNA polymerase II core subunit rpo21 n=1 Tax=Entomophthora muscae TaxID=34485 RepID=A0ACC2S344_9FUNG|nr:DNA-directed RNA polymerase II core subunit rpo21 [Entomophthora muscae]